MKVEHRLSSNLIIRQDYSRSVRFLMFETGLDYFRYATHGGTVFIVSYKGSYYGLTCVHNLHDFEWCQLVVTNSRFGDTVAGVKAVYKPDLPTGEAVESDILDVLVIAFDEEATASFFGDQAYVLDEMTVCESSIKDTLEINGALKDNSSISEDEINAVFTRLQFLENHSTSSDVVLRNGIGRFHEEWLTSLSGISGSPVFNITKKKLCGMVMRGTLNAELTNIWYVDISDIVKILQSIADGSLRAEYVKEKARI